jgi:cell division protein FtsW
VTRYDGRTVYSDAVDNGRYERTELKDKTEATRNKKRGPMDLPFFLLTLIILTVGVVMVFSASFARAYYSKGNATLYFRKQLIFAISGILIMYVVSRVPVRSFRRYSMLLLFASIVMLALVPFIGIGKEETGANRWFNLGFTTFQPSEVAKLAVILAFASMICIYKDKMRTFKYGVLPFGIVLAIIVGLLVLEPHLSASIIIIAVGAIMMFAGGTRWQYFVVGIIVVAAIGTLLVTKMAYASTRISTWLDPFAVAQDEGFQTVQSLYAIGSGGLMGLGLGQGRQKYLYLPEEHNDFIFSIVCEELGFIGAILVLLLFALLIIRGYWLAMHARDRFGALVITGISSLLAIQVFLNVAVVTNLVPCTGISLPFFSYGGTALWIQLAEMGIVLSISRDIPLQRKENNEKGKSKREEKE